MCNSSIHYLVVSLLGPWNDNIHSKLANTFSELDCNVLQSYLNQYGEEFIGSIHLSGSWGAIAKCEIKLSNVAKNFGLHLSTSRSQASPRQANVLPYKVQVIASERVGIVDDLVSFFAKKGVALTHIRCHTFSPHPRCSNMNKISMGFYFNIKHNIASLRDSFMTYCDDKNFDGYFECDYQAS